jgi:hypothetical protein
LLSLSFQAFGLGALPFELLRGLFVFDLLGFGVVSFEIGDHARKFGGREVGRKGS